MHLFSEGSATRRKRLEMPPPSAASQGGSESLPPLPPSTSAGSEASSVGDSNLSPASAKVMDAFPERDTVVGVTTRRTKRLRQPVVSLMRLEAQSAHSTWRSSVREPLLKTKLTGASAFAASGRKKPGPRSSKPV